MIFIHQINGQWQTSVYEKQQKKIKLNYKTMMPFGICHTQGHTYTEGLNQPRLKHRSNGKLAILYQIVEIPNFLAQTL